MPVPMLDLKRQYDPLHQELLQALEHVLQTQQFILGEPVADFERGAAAQLGVAHALGCSSGTDALWLALAAAGIGPGDAVVTTPFSFFASVSAILRAGATAALVDIDPATFNLSPVAVETALNARQPVPIKAILPVHLYGQCADWTSFTRLGHGFGVKLIEDAAQAWGAEWNGVKAGGLGEIAAFSFYPTKNLSAAGDAGMVTTNSDELAERVKMLRQHGMRRRYQHDEVGWNARMDGFQGAVLGVNLRYIAERNALRRQAAERYTELFHSAILSVKLKYIEGWNEARRAIAERYHALFAAAGLAEPSLYPSHGIVLPQEVRSSKHVWHQYVIRTPRRDQLREFLAARKIGSEIYYPVPLHEQTALEFLGFKQGDFPEAERAAREVLALPIFPELREDEQQTVVAAIADFLS
jgi:dTDP-4-amino-4,6-dideoxygalactose transaminase